MLIVDDEIFNIQAMKTQMEDEGFAVDVSTSGTEAVKLVRERIEKVYQGQGEMYKLILLDYSMPDMDGPQVATHIRALFKNTILLSEDQ